jgi:hypothetical protein
VRVSVSCGHNNFFAGNFASYSKVLGLGSTYTQRFTPPANPIGSFEMNRPQVEL